MRCEFGVGRGRYGCRAGIGRREWWILGLVVLFIQKTCLNNILYNYDYNTIIRPYTWWCLLYLRHRYWYTTIIIMLCSKNLEIRSVSDILEVSLERGQESHVIFSFGEILAEISSQIFE